MTGRKAPAKTEGNVEYVLVNGDFRVHKLGCADTKKLIARRETDYEQPMTAKFTSQTEMVLDLWDDIIGDNWDQDDFAKLDTQEKIDELNTLFGATVFAPCTKRILKADQPTEPHFVSEIEDGKLKSDSPAKADEADEADEPVNRKRDAKQALARRILDAVAAETSGDGDEAKKVVAQWLHHLNAGKDGDTRYWPAALPRPDRSDWR